MKRSELKSIIKECVKETLFEEGVLSEIIAEVAYGITKAQGLLAESSTQLVEKAQPTPAADKAARLAREEEHRKTLLETKRKMLNAIGDKKMGNVFEGTEPLKAEGSHASTIPALQNRDPSDAGVDISGLFNLAGRKWQQLK